MNPGGKKVLIVGGEAASLDACAKSLKSYAPDLDILIAENGLQAVGILNGAPVALVVTGLAMPGMDGFQLLVHMRKHFPAIPVIVTMAAGAPDIVDRLKKVAGVRCLRQPLNVEELALRIFQEIAASERTKTGVTLAGFLQLVAIERKTCALKVRSAEKSGILLIKDGDLVDARTENRGGEAAAREIVAWDDAEIKMGNYTGERRKNVYATLGDILQDAFRLKSDRESIGPGRREPALTVVAAASAAPADPVTQAKRVAAVPRAGAGNGPVRAVAAAAPTTAIGDAPAAAAPEAIADPPQSQVPAPADDGPAAGPGDRRRTLKELLSGLSRLQGVSAVCLAGRDGFLIERVLNADMEADLVAAIGSAGFGASESIGGELGTGPLEIAMLEFARAAVVVAPLGRDFRLVVMARRDASLGMLRVKIRQLSGEIEAAANAV